MKNALIILLLGLVYGNSVHGQESIKVSGQLKDAETKETLPFCKVIALNASDSIVSGGITDDKGFFNLPVTPGNYKLIVSFYGYENDTIITGVLQQDKFFGVVKLLKSALEVGEVNAIGSSRFEGLEKEVQIITDQLKQGTTAAKDVLQKISGISYDEYSGALKVDNDANFMILVNGVEKSQEYVQNLDPERLLRVELTRDPGGRYGLEGYSAILNVVLKGDYKGSEVYVEEMQLVDVNTQKSKLDLMIGSLGATYNYTYNNFNIYARAQIERRNFKISSDSETNYDDGVTVSDHPLSEDPNFIILEHSLDYTLGFDYRINPKHLVSFESNISNLPTLSNIYDSDYRTEIFMDDSLLYEFEMESQTKNKKWETYNTLFYIGDINAKNKVNLNFTYSNYKDLYQNSTAQTGFFERNEEGVNRKDFTRFYAEWDHVISSKMGFQIGYGNTYLQLKSQYDITQVDPFTITTSSFSGDFNLSDLRNKLYANYSWRINKKWGMQLGMGAENSYRESAGAKLNNTIYQPLFDLKYSPNRKMSLKLKYRAYGSYPTIAQTNPFVSQQNFRITSTGNPLLKPYTTHRLSLRMNFYNGLFAIEPYLQYSNNRIAQIGDIDTSNVFNYRFENVDLFQRNGVRVNFSKYFKFSLLIQGNIELFQAKLESSSTKVNVMDVRASMDVIYIFPKSQMLIGAKYQRQQNKQINGLGYGKGDVDFWMLFYKVPLFKQKASIMFGYFLPIDFGANYNQESHQETTGFEMHSNNDVNLIKNMFILEFSYRFNKGKSIKKMNKNVEKEKEDSGGGLF